MRTLAASFKASWLELTGLFSLPGRRALVLPFAVFMALLGLLEILVAIGHRHGPFWLASPQYWIYPLQTISCAFLLWRYRRWYALGKPVRPGFTLLSAVLVLVIWISPQSFFGAPGRYEGFDPHVFGQGTPLHAGILALRLLRSIVVVPFLEEIFWRAFLLRFLIKEHFEEVPFGAFTLFSCAGVTLCFAFAHWGPDFWPAVCAGLIFNAVAYRTRSLSSCILAHASANLLLDAYILRTGQWGFW